MERQAIIIGGEARKPWLESRTRRNLQAAGFTVVSELAGPCLLIRAGEVLRSRSAFVPPPSAGSSRLMAIGLPVSGDWLDFHRLHGGDYRDHAGLPPLLCEWHSSVETARARWNEEMPDSNVRAVHWPALDLSESGEALRIWQVVTSLQHGGAERIAWELATTLPSFGFSCRLVALGCARRRSYQIPAGTLDFSGLPRSERADRLNRLALSEGVDVLHVHLTDMEETRGLAQSGIPVVATVHNARQGWPKGWENLGRKDLDLLIACSLAVERELRDAVSRIPVRTVWNGIDPRSYPESPLPALGKEVRLVCVANPRPQKRLHLLPSILVEFQRALGDRCGNDFSVKLVIAGETAADYADAVNARDRVNAEAERLGVADWITWTEGRRPVHEVLRESHAMISCSAYEGLSLAHLEALSAGRPVVACDVGGTSEIAWRNPAMRLLGVSASPADFAEALVEVVLNPPPSFHRRLWRDFTVERMSSRVGRLLRAAACKPCHPGETVWFATNNLATGGAQSSLRRLVRRFHQSGIKVCVALLQEYPEHATVGRVDLLDAGIPVFVPPPAGLIEPEESADLILAEMAARPPRCVVFWNAIAAHKLLLADALPFTRCHDVSPGEMWFAAMEKCLAEPPPGLPVRSESDYGRLLSGLVVKYHAECDRMVPFGSEVAVIPNGITVPADLPERRPSFVARVFGTAVRISPQKRLDELLAAFRLVASRLPDVVLRIAGGVETGAEAHAEELRRLSDGLPVEWLGELNGLGEFHTSCEVFVMISDPAGCPNALLEALAAGLPVVATDVGGASEQVIDGVTGLLVPSRDPELLADAMCRLALDPDARERLATAARNHVRSRFSMERMFHSYSDLLIPDSPVFAGRSLARGKSRAHGFTPPF